jgi:hypothetical protein
LYVALEVGRVVVLVVVEDRAVLPKRKEPKRKTIAEMLTDHIQGSPAQKLALLEKLKARVGLEAEDRAELLKSKACCARSHVRGSGEEGLAGAEC